MKLTLSTYLGLLLTWLDARAQTAQPRLNAPTRAIVGDVGLVASAPAQPNTTYAWRVNGASITAGQTGRTVTFNTDAAGKIVLACTLTSGDASTQITATVPVFGAGSTAIVSVNGGYGGGSFPAGSVLDIWAAPPSPGYLFDRWSGDAGMLEDPTSSHTLLRLPAAGARVTATYRAVAAWTPTTIANFGGPGVDLAYFIPNNPRGLMFFFHGAGGGGPSNFTKLESRLFFAEFIAAGYGMAAYDSSDRNAKQWNNSPDLKTNPDLVNLVAAITRFRTTGQITAQTPLYFSGMSNGGGMAPRAAAVLAAASAGYPVAAAMSSCASGNAQVMAATTVPQLWNLQRNDANIGDTGNSDSVTNFATLLVRGIPAQLQLQLPTPVFPERFAVLSMVYPEFTAADSRAIYNSLKSGGFLDANDYLRDVPTTALVTALVATVPSAYARYAQEIGNLLNVSYATHEFNGDIRRRALAFFNHPDNLYQPAVPAGSDARLANLSTRASVRGGGNLIVGFVIEGTAPRRVLLRGVGPALAGFGVTDALAKPNLTLYSGSTVQRTNAGWGNETNASVIAAITPTLGAFPLAAGSADAALLESLAPHAYTALLGSADNTSGVALVEVYDAPAATENGSGTRLVNLSARATAGSGNATLIAGFVVQGSAPSTFLIRAIGPSLASYGVGDALPDPRLQLVGSATGETLAVGDNWGNAANAADLRGAMAKLGAFALPDGSLDSALLATLSPGGYTAVVSGPGSASGTALVEVYAVPPPAPDEGKDRVGATTGASATELARYADAAAWSAQIHQANGVRPKHLWSSSFSPSW